LRGRDGEKDRETHGGERETETERESTEDLRGRYGDRDRDAKLKMRGAK
jgi:hypothetical protein